MKNLAGVSGCDADIRAELERARVPIVETHRATGEVPFSLMGRIGEFEFRRAWVYWVVTGPTPLAIAKELYADPVGVKDVRVAGHCACPPPEQCAEYRDGYGKKVVLDTDGEQRKELANCIEVGLLTAAYANDYRFVETEAERDAAAISAVVDTYHIDTEVGLRLYVDTLRKHGLA